VIAALLAITVSLAACGPTAGRGGDATTGPSATPKAAHLPTLLAYDITGDNGGTSTGVGNLAAFDPTTGHMRWRQTVPAPTSQPIVGESALYITQASDAANGGASASPASNGNGYSENLEALSLGNGAPLWSVTLNNQIGPIAERQGVLYASAPFADFEHPVPVGLVVAFDAANGAQRWATRLTAGAISGEVFTPSAIFILATNPFGANGQATAAVVALRPSDGHILWTTPQPNVAHAQTQLLADGGRVYVVAAPSNTTSPVASAQIDALDGGSGRGLWSQAYDNVITHVAVVATNGALYLPLAPPSPGEMVTALRGSDGSTQWSAPVNAAIYTLVVSQGAVYVNGITGDTNQSKLYAFALNGAPQWNIMLSEGFVFKATANAQTLYLAATPRYGTASNALEARAAARGALEWRQTITGSVSSLALTA